MALLAAFATEALVFFLALAAFEAASAFRLRTSSTSSLQ